MQPRSARDTLTDKDKLSLRGSMASLSRYPSAGVRSIGASSIAGSVYASTILSIDEEENHDYVDWDDDGRHIAQLNDQQWVLQRKKIGLSRHTEKIESKKKFLNKMLLENPRADAGPKAGRRR